jgi:hypothetical protein
MISSLEQPILISSSLLDDAVSTLARQYPYTLPAAGDQVKVLTVSAEDAPTLTAFPRLVYRTAIVQELLDGDAASRTCTILYDGSPNPAANAGATLGGEAPQQPVKFTFELGYAGQVWWPAKNSSEAVSPLPSPSSPANEGGGANGGGEPVPARRSPLNLLRAMASLSSNSAYRPVAAKPPPLSPQPLPVGAVVGGAAAVAAAAAAAAAAAIYGKALGPAGPSQGAAAAGTTLELLRKATAPAEPAEALLKDGAVEWFDAASGEVSAVHCTAL